MRKFAWRYGCHLLMKNEESHLRLFGLDKKEWIWLKKKKNWDSFNLKKKKPLIVMKIDISIKEVIKKLL